MFYQSIRKDIINNKIPKLIVIFGMFASLYFALKGVQYFNREIYLLLSIVLFYRTVKNRKLIQLSFLQIIFLIFCGVFYLIDFYLERNSRTTSFINIIIFGFIYYFIEPRAAPQNVYSDFMFLIKVLIVLILIEQTALLFKLIDENFFKDLIPFFHIYTSKFFEVFYPGGQAAQSIYLGPQIGSMILLFGIILYFPYVENELLATNQIIWFYISLILFIFIFTFTSILMLIFWMFYALIFYRKSRKKLLKLALLLGPGVAYISINFFLKLLTSKYGSSQIEVYFNTFTNLFFKFFEMDWTIIMFGLSNSLETTYISETHEFGFSIIVSMLGIFFLIFIITAYLNIFFIYIKERFEIHQIQAILLISLLLVSCTHYLVILKTGPALLFAMIIYYYLLSVNISKDSI